MTVRDLVQTLLLKSPDLDADIYVIDEDFNDHIVIKIDNEGAPDAVFIRIKDWEWDDDD